MISKDIGFTVAIFFLIAALQVIFFLEYISPLSVKIKERPINKMKVMGILFIGSFLVYWLCNNHSFNVYNNFSYLAQSLLEGHLDVSNMPEYLESVTYEGKKYMHFAPGPSLLSLPFVALLGVDKFNCAWLVMFLGACNMPLSVRVLENMNIGKCITDRIWLGAMLNFGTVHFFCASQGSSWFFGHVATLFFLLLSLVFFTEKKVIFSDKNMFLSGLFFGLAVTCRLAALFGFIFFAGYLILYCKEKWKKIFVFCCGAAIFGFLYMAYNFVRYDTIMDMGYNLTYLKDMHREAYDALQAAPVEEQKELFKQYRKECGGPLQLQFIKHNLYSIFLLPPEFKKVFPFVVPTMAGMAVSFTSPMFYTAIFADRKKKLTWILVITMILTAFPFLMNYGNGMAQFGMRYSMDFTPYLWLLMCYGLTRKGRMKLWMKIGIAVCILIQGWGTLFWTYFYC